jgi:hypothetical protein
MFGLLYLEQRFEALKLSSASTLRRKRKAEVRGDLGSDLLRPCLYQS